jgi:3-oxoacyl-[acyl-carrier-protein] synthase II
MDRIAITDVGLVTAAGVGEQPAWDRIVEGRSCVGPVRTFDARAFEGAWAAELVDLPPPEGQGRPVDEDRAFRLLAAAARGLSPELVDHLKGDRDAAQRTAVVLGTSKGGVTAMAPIHRRWAAGTTELSSGEVEAIDVYRAGYGAQWLADFFSIAGPRSTVGMACVSGAMALLHGAELINAGVVDRALVGGFDGFGPFVFAGFWSIGALTRTQCRPFDVERDGTVLGEAAALLLLERETAARARGVRPRAWFAGGASNSDGVHLTAPDREGRGLARAVGQALQRADRQPQDIRYINAHGTGTKYNDAMECAAFQYVFGDLPLRPPMSSNKSIFGHSLGAAGAVDAVVTILALERQFLPPTVNHDQAARDWDFIPGQGRQADNLQWAMTTNSGFAGNNTALIFQRCGG